MMSLPTTFDLTAIHAVQAALPSWVITLAKILKVLAMPEYWVIAGLGLSWWWMENKRRTAALALFWFTAGNALTPILKAVFRLPRPTVDAVSVYAHEGTFGMPSGHALGAAIMVAVIWWWTKKKSYKRWRTVIRIAAVIFALVVGWSRVALGVHWPSDVLAGWLIGGLWGAGVLLAIGHKK